MEERKFTEQELVRREKAKELESLGIDPFGHRFEVTTNSKEIKEQYAQYSKEELHEMELEEVTIAGRIMTRRRKGKVGFMHIQDKYGQIQIYVRQDVVGEDEYALFKKADLGDIVGIKGTVFRTDMGELSIRAEHYIHLVKALKPLPEKFHGLTDTEERYRRRYVDLIMNEDARRVAFARPKIIRSIQHYLDNLGYVEVETPVLGTILGGAAARPFVTHHNTLDIDMYLRIATELPLKRLLVGGMDAVYEIGRLFRNEGMDRKHNPEFTTIEVYKAFSDLEGMMDLTENLYRHLAEKVCGSAKIEYNGIEMDLSKPFERLTMVDAVKKYAGVDWNEVETVEQARELAKEHHVEFEEHHKKGDILNLFFEEFVEEHLVQPTFIMDHPIEISPLTKKKPENPEYVERFEFFMNGWEMANAYSELNDPIDQRERFKAQEELLALGDEEANTTDEDFMNALEIGMPPTGGIGFGIDRMCMLLTNAAAIRDVLLFPTMKQLDK